MRSRDGVCALVVFALGAGCGDNGPPAVVLTAVSPPLASIAGGDTVRLSGSGYVPGVRVRFGDVPALVQVDSAEQLSVLVPPWSQEQGLVAISVQRPDGPLASRDDLFSYYALAGRPETHLTPAAALRAVAVADWNRDGRADLAVATSNPTAVTLLLSQPDGSLRATQRYDAGTDPTALLVADVSGDGQPDLLLADAGTSTVRILLGRSEGKLVAMPPVAAGCAPIALAAGAVAAGGRVDVVVVCREPGAGARRLVNLGSQAGAPLFDVPRALAVAAEPVAVQLADFDGDGFGDVVVASRAGTVSVLWGTQGGGFLPTVEVPVGQQPAALLAVDLLGDSRPELVVADAGSRDVRVLAYDAAIGLSLVQKAAVAGRPQQLVALPRAGGGVQVAALSGEGGAGSLVAVLGGRLTRSGELDAGASVTSAVAADVDGDGQPELILAQPERGQLGVLGRAGAGWFVGPPLSIQGTPRGVSAVDANGDGLLDVAWGDAAAGGLRVLLSQGGGPGLAPFGPVPTAAGVAAVAAADLNHDLAPDLVAACPDSGAVSVLISVGPSLFQASIEVPTGLRPELLAVAEVTGDQELDVLVAARQGSELRVLPGGGDGSLGAPRVVAVGAAVQALLALDVDGDGRRDAVVLATDGVHVVRRDAAGRLFLTAAFPAGEAPTALTALDVNTDGVLDLAVASATSGQVQLLLGKPDGSFSLVQSLAVGLGLRPRYLTALDVNRDGNLDVVVAAEGAPELRLLLGRADGFLQPPVVLPLGLVPSGLARLDLDGDRILDLFAMGPEGYSVLLAH